MAENRRDVNLVIRAKDEASRAFEQATSVLEKLVGINARVGHSATDAGSDLAKLASIALDLDKVYAAVNGSANRAADSFARQQAALAGQRESLAAVQAQANAARAALEKLNGAEAIVSAGRNQGPRLQQIEQVVAEIRRLEQSEQKLKSSIALVEADLDSQRSSLQQIGSTAIAVEQAQSRLRTSYDQTSAAMREQAQAASVLQTVERNTGVNRDSAEYQALVAQIQATSNARNEEIAKLKAEEAATAQLSRAKEEQARINQLLNIGTSGKSAQASAAVFQQADVEQQQNLEKAAKKAAQAAREEEAAIAELKAELNPLAVAEQKAAIEAAKLEDWLKRGKITATEHAAAMNLVETSLKRAKAAMGGIDTRGRPSLFGLRPYEVQNLSFQVNDIITQLASGTSLSQTLAQQSGQIIQLFPQIGNAIIAAFRSPPVLAFAAAIGAVVIGLQHAQGEAERLRTLNAVLALNADGAQHSAAALNEASKSLIKYGLSAEDALKVVRSLVAEGFDDSQVVKLGQSAQVLADVLGISVTDAAKQIGDAFRGSYDSIKKLDEGTNFLSASQREHIKVLFEQGRVDEARAEALRIFEQKMDDVSGKMRGPWYDATKNLKGAWVDFKDALADNSAIDGLAEGLAKLGRGASDLIAKLRGIRNIGNVDSEIQDLQAKIKVRQEGGVRGFLAGLDSPTTVAQDQQKLNQLYAERSRILTQIGQQQDASGNKTRQQSELQKEANADLEAEVTKLKAQGSLLDQKTRLQLTYKEALLEAQKLFPNASRELQQQYALTKQKIQQAQFAKENAAAAERAASAAERERKEREKNARDPVFQSQKLLREFEGFTGRAKWDVNAFRVGFGSDTVTRQDGTVQRVQRGTTVSMDDAVRDLERRIAEFQNVIKQQIGTERFNQFGAQQQAALTSIAYNYGSLPERILQAVKTGSSEQIAAAVRGLAGDNNGINAKRRNREADILGNPNVAVDQGATEALLDIEKERLKVQGAFDEKLREENESRQRDIASMQAQKGLIGDALLAEQRREFIADAVLKKEQEIAKVNAQRALDGKPLIVFAEQEKQKVAELAGAYFDLAHAKDAAANARGVVEQPVEDLSSQRDALEQRIDFLRQNGDEGMARQLLPQLDAVNDKLRQAIANNIAFWESVLQGAHGGAAAFGMTNTQIQTLITGLETAGMQAQRLTTFMGLTANQIADAFTGDAVQGISQFAQAVAEGENVFHSLKDAFLSFAASFLQQIAQMILKQLIFNAISGFMKSIGLGVPVAHTGGVIGKSSLVSRNVSPMLFAGAMRYHGGGIAGLRPDEVPAILQKGEEVITAADPRHRDNGGGLAPAGGNGATGIRQVLAIGDDEIAGAVAGAAGERVVMTHIRRNIATLRAELNG